MRQRALKTAIVTVEVLAIVVALAAAVASLVIWRLGQGPMPLNFFRSSAEAAIERRFPEGYDAQIASLELRRGALRGDFDVVVSQIAVTDVKGETAAAAPEIRFTIAAGDLLNRKIGPKSIEATGASFHIIRHADRKLDVPVARKLASHDRSAGVVAQIEARLVKSAFQRAAFDAVEITFVDEASGRSWSTTDAQLQIEQTETGLTARTRGAITMAGGRAAIDASGVYDRAAGIINLTIDGENFPAGDILGTFYGDNAAILDAPVSGRAVMSITPEGDVKSSEFDAQIGEGKFILGGGERRISRIAWRTGFDPVANRFSLDHFTFDVEGAQGVIAGDISVSFGDNIRKPERVNFNLASDEIVIDAGERLPAPLPLTNVAVTGEYDIAARLLNLQSVAATASGLAGSGAIVVSRPRNGGEGGSPGIVADLDFTGDLDRARLLSVWPRSLAAGARVWVEDRLATATISNLDARVNLPPGAITGGEGLADDALTLTFDASNVVAHYVKGMTPLRAGAGKGIVNGNSFRLDIDKAMLGEIRITKGQVEFPEFMPKWRPTYYRFTAVGDTERMLSVLDEAPLRLLSKVNLSPAQFSGAARADIEISRPNKRDVLPEEYGYKGVANFEGTTLRDIVGDLQITGAAGRVDLSTRSFTVTADAAFADDAPVAIKWTQNFYRADGPSRLAVKGIFNSSAGDVFGLPSRQILHGPVAFEADATGEFGAFETLALKADFTEAALIGSAFGWRKAAGLPASGALDVAFGKDVIEVDGFSIAGDGVEIAGALSFDRQGVLQSADVPRFFLQDGAELSVAAKRDASGVLDLTAVGPYLNIGDFLEQTLEASDGEAASGLWGKGVNVSARIDRLTMRHGVEYRDGALDLRRDAERMQELNFTAFDGDEKPLTVAMVLTGADDGAERAIEARTSAIGELMRGVFGYDSIRGGEGSMRLALHQPERKGFSGEIEARNIQVVNAPLLARIFSAGSFDGLANLLNGDGIDFSYAHGKFKYADRALVLDDLRVTGSSVGMTAQGVIGVGVAGQTDLSGTVAPLNQINAVLGAAPIIGDILTGTKGEGIVAFTYRVSGDTGGPQVFVNPLSALTPGILRQLMQPARAPDRPAPDAPLPVENKP